MPTIKEQAEAYEPKQTKNIADLDKVSVELEIIEQPYTDKKGKTFTINEIEINGEAYRVPDSVLKSLKAILEAKPDLKTFKVVKSGSGLSTEYTVVPLE